MFVGPEGVIPDLRWTVPAADLASTTERYFQEVRGTGQVYGDATYPGLGIGIGIPEPVRMPGESIQYTLSRPSAIYEVGYDQFPSGYGGGQNDAWYAVRPGQHFTEDWNQDPCTRSPWCSC